MKTLNEMPKATLIEMVENLQQSTSIKLSVGNATDNRGVVEYRFENEMVTFVGTGEGESKTIELAKVFAHADVMQYLLRYAIKRATNDTCKTYTEVVERVELWEKGYATLADYKAATKVEPIKVAKASGNSKPASIGGLTDGEIIAAIESLGEDFADVASKLMTVQPAMFAPAVKFLSEKHGAVAKALQAKAEAKRQTALAAQQAELASMFG